MKDKPLLRFAHISDLHFSKTTFGLSQFFSKRWIGNLNLLINRQKNFDQAQLYTLLPLFHEYQVDAVLITGDLTTTSHPKEFELAKEFTDALTRCDIKFFLLPGNHDNYTRTAYQNQYFYRYFDTTYSTATDPLSSLQMKEHKIAATSLGHNWWLFALDSTLATSLFSSHGVFSQQLEENLERALKLLPPDHNVILLNHFPLFDTESAHKSLQRSESLRAILQRFPQIKLYLHGHTHQHVIADLRPSGLPIVLDSGCTAQKDKATWNLIDITPTGCEITVFKKQQSCYRDQWQNLSQTNLTW